MGGPIRDNYRAPAEMGRGQNLAVLLGAHPLQRQEGVGYRVHTSQSGDADGDRGVPAPGEAASRVEGKPAIDWTELGSYSADGE